MLKVLVFTFLVPELKLREVSGVPTTALQGTKKPGWNRVKITLYAAVTSS